MNLESLLAWSLAVAVLVTAGIAGARFLDWRDPLSRLRFLQALLLSPGPNGCASANPSKAHR